MLVLTRNNFEDNTDILEGNVWYNIWKNKESPHNILENGQSILIKVDDNLFYSAKITHLLKYGFNNPHHILGILQGMGYIPYKGDPYWNKKTHIEKGYLLAYKFKIISKIEHNPKIRRIHDGWYKTL